MALIVVNAENLEGEPIGATDTVRERRRKTPGVGGKMWMLDKLGDSLDEQRIREHGYVKDGAEDARVSKEPGNTEIGRLCKTGILLAFLT